MTRTGPPGATPDRPVVVVGGGISGVACARVLTGAGVPVRLRDRGRRIGGRMAVRTCDTAIGRHLVDVGAAYLTARDPRFKEVVADWEARGLARRWTDTFHLATPEGLEGTTTGPVRWAAPAGLRSLVEDLAEGLEVEAAAEVAEVGLDAVGAPTVDRAPVAAAVLAMPDPQALDLLSARCSEELAVLEGRAWAPVVSVYAAWSHAWWPDLDGAFVDSSAVLSWVADDGRRRGDDAPVLVAHTTHVFAAGRLDDPPTAIAPVLAELACVLGGGLASFRPPEPEWARAQRWSLAYPRSPHKEPFFLSRNGIGFCGDGWGEKPRVEQAWLSGTRLGEALLERLA